MNRHPNIICLLALSILISLNIFARISDDQVDDFQKAENFLRSNKFDEALPLYLSVLEFEPENSNFNYRVGQCYINLLGKEREALPYLKKAVVEIEENYKPGSLKSSGAAPHAFLLLGDAYHRDEMLDEASKAYNKYKQYIADNKKELELVTERIIGLGVAQDEDRDHPRDVMLSNLGDKINTKYSDYNVVYSGDEKSMVFTRYEKKKDIIFYSYMKDGSWTDPVDISDQIGSLGDMYATALSHDGTELFLILLTPYDADIYVSKLNNGQWEYAENIGKGINSKYVESNACISTDGKTLYFSSDRAASIGGFDLFSSTRVEGRWGKAVSLGETINTKSNEESPFLVQSGKTLYFSSDRSGTIGRMDVYFSRLENEEWGAPENLGLPYNSVEDDVAFKYYEKYNKGYIARDLPGGFGKLDLYLIQSGADRQRELADYMASLAPPEPVIETPVVVAATMPEVIPEVEETKVEPEIKTEEEPAAEIPVAEVATVAVVAEVVKEEPKVEPVEEIVMEEAPVEEIEEKIPEPVVREEPKQVYEGEYTIQILALIFPKRISNYNGLNPNQIRSIAGDDGYTRFIYGQYTTYKAAKEALRIPFSKGYKDAYIRKTSEISNFE